MSSLYGTPNNAVGLLFVFLNCTRFGVVLWSQLLQEPCVYNNATRLVRPPVCLSVLENKVSKITTA